MTPDVVGAEQIRTRRRRRGHYLVVHGDALADGAMPYKATGEADWANTDKMAAVERRASGTRTQEGGQFATGADGAAGVVRRENRRGTSWAAGTVFTTAQSRAPSTRPRNSAEVRRHGLVVGN